MKFTIIRTEESDGNWFKVKAEDWTKACFKFDKETETSKYVDALLFYDKLVKEYQMSKTLIIKEETI